MSGRGPGRAGRPGGDAARPARPRTRGRQALRRAGAQRPAESAAAANRSSGSASKVIADRRRCSRTSRRHPGRRRAARTDPRHPDRRVVGRRQLPDARRGPPKSSGSLVPADRTGQEGRRCTPTSTTSIGEGTEIELPGTGGSGRQPRVRPVPQEGPALPAESTSPSAAVAKVRSGEPITADDIAELQRILVAAGIGDDDDLRRSQRTSRQLRPVRPLARRPRPGSSQASVRRRSSTTSATARTRSSSST